MWACFDGNASMARSLVRYGADARKVDADQSTPLGIAAYGGHADVIKVLASSFNFRCQT
jgi:ankyrin repeat protein